MLYLSTIFFGIVTWYLELIFAMPTFCLYSCQDEFRPDLHASVRTIPAADAPALRQRFSIVRIEMSLTKDAPQRADRDLAFLRQDDVSTVPPAVRSHLTWLPFWLTSTNPTASRRRLISRKGSGLSRPNLYLDGAEFWWTGSLWLLEVKLQRFLQVRKRLLFRLTLTRDVNFEALRDKPVSFAPDGCGECSLHDHIVPHAVGDTPCRVL